MIMKVSRKGRVLGDFTLEQIVEGAQSGSFLPTDDILVLGETSWRKLSSFKEVNFVSAYLPSVLPVVDELPPRPPEFNLIYRSSDEGLLLGFCAGIGHRFRIHGGIVRLAYVIIILFTASIMFWLYWLTIFLPRYPTRNVP